MTSEQYTHHYQYEFEFNRLLQVKRNYERLVRSSGDTNIILECKSHIQKIEEQLHTLRNNEAKLRRR